MPISRRQLLACGSIAIAAYASVERHSACAQEQLRVGFSDSPPISMRGGAGELEGFAVSAFAATAARAGITVQQELVPFGELLSGLISRRFDIVVMSPTPERRQSAIFTQPLAAYGETLIIRADDPVNYVSISQLRGKTVGSNAGGGWISAVREAGGSIKTYPAAEQTLIALESGEVEAIIGNAPTYRYLMRAAAHPKARISDSYKPVQVNELSFAVRPEDVLLRDHLDQAVGALQVAGELQTLRARWGF